MLVFEYKDSDADVKTGRVQAGDEAGPCLDVLS